MDGNLFYVKERRTKRAWFCAMFYTNNYVKENTKVNTLYLFWPLIFSSHCRLRQYCRRIRECSNNALKNIERRDKNLNGRKSILQYRWVIRLSRLCGNTSRDRKSMIEGRVMGRNTIYSWNRMNLGGSQNWNEILMLPGSNPIEGLLGDWSVALWAWPE